MDEPKSKCVDIFFSSWLATAALSQSPPGLEEPQAIMWGALTVRSRAVTVLTAALKLFESDAQISL